MIQHKTETEHDLVEFTILETRLRASSDGKLERYMRSNRWKSIENKPNHCQGYNVVLINKKQIMRGRILACAFLNIDVFDKNIIVYYKDDNRLNCSVDNLSIQTRKSINYFRNSKGYYYDKWNKKYVPLITHNGITKKLMPCNTAEEAHQVYLNEKRLLIKI